jgi:phospholipase D1/2
MQRILRPGETCWRTPRADRFAVIVDARDYFAAAKAAMSKARHSIYLIGWDFDLRIRLEPDGNHNGLPDQLGRFLRAIVHRQPMLRAFVLKWDTALLWTLGRQIIPMLMIDWWRHHRIHFRLDSAHPTGAAHHQKIIVIDDVLAFCGGIDMTNDRWDTRAHRPGDPHRRRPDGSACGPWHDTTAVVDGAAARALGELARERWRRATGESLPPPEPLGDLWPRGIKPMLRNVDVAIARTAPVYEGRPQINEIERLCLEAIAAAREAIYVESQYFASVTVRNALAERLCERDGPEVVVVNPLTAEGWLEEVAMGSARTAALRHLHSADRYDRFRIYYPVNEAGEPIYVHAKVLVIDNRLLRVGSSNINNRSMGFDTECDLAVEAVPGTPNEAQVRAAVAAVRDDLLAEHLGVAPGALADALQKQGSLVRAIEVLRRSGGRTLRELERTENNAAEAFLVETQLLDPERPNKAETRLKHWMKRTFLPVPPKAYIIATILAAAVVAERVLHGRRRSRKPRR